MTSRAIELSGKPSAAGAIPQQMAGPRSLYRSYTEAQDSPSNPYALMNTSGIWIERSGAACDDILTPRPQNTREPGEDPQEQ
jgi:hypothetical protein